MTARTPERRWTAPEGDAVAERRNDVWAAHPVWAATVRVVVFLVPLVLSVLTGLYVSRLLPLGDTTLARIGWWLAVFVVSSIVLFLTDRFARRFLPLAVLLELSLVFPDRAPSRLRSVRTASVRELETRLSHLREHGEKTPPIAAAETLVTLVGLLGVHDKRTRGHSERVRALVDLLTDEMGLSEEERGRARWAALVHDMGKLTVPATVLNKAGGLDDEEWDNVRRHPDEGVRLLGGLLPWLGEWGRAVGEHHERWDGTGYPNGLAGDQIGLGARIVAVADAYEVMTSARSYGRARSASVARKELTACAGSQFDPQVVRCFLSISLGRLRWVVGPLTWLAEIPFLALDRGGQAARLAAATLGVGGLAVTGAIAPPAGLDPTLSPAPPGATGPAAGLSSDVLLAGTDAPAAAPRAAAAPGSPALAATAPRPAGAGATPSPAPRAPASARPEAATQAARPRPTPSTYWFGTGPSGYTLAPHLPPRAGPPPDTDRDGRPGRTLVATREGLDATQRPEYLVLFRAVDRPLHLDGVPQVVLWSRLAEPRGNARVQVRLDDCTAAGRCTPLTTGQEVDGTWSSGTAFVPHTLDLDRVDVTVAAGHRLRLTIVTLDPGTRGDLLVGLASRSTPSRIVLPVG